MSDPKCGNCKWWERDIKDLVPPHPWGKCRCLPVIGPFPATDSESWCGDFEERDAERAGKEWKP